MTDLMMSDSARLVTGGVDTHKDFHVVAVIDAATRLLGTESFPATEAGYRDVLEWLTGFGPLCRVGVEGTGSYGKGLARFLTAESVAVVEVIRPDRQSRRRNGKSDAADAEAAAITALSGRDSGTPKTGTGPVEALRVLRVARDSAVRQTTVLTNQIGAVLNTAPEPVVAKHGSKQGRELWHALVRARPGPDPFDPATATVHTLRLLARQRAFIADQVHELDNQMEAVVSVAAPRLLSRLGVGPQTATALLICAGDNPERLATSASFTALCGASPVPTNSGKQQGRYRLNRSGDRRANSALWRITMTRMFRDDRTKTYVERRTSEGLTKPEVMRCLKTYIARELHPIIVADLSAL